ncbi:MAG TPA: hypothetical protein VFA58_01350 [Chthoniobacterales bacterium]|nr:hypothetical protein [Chthoniobacterales bacterium]
MKDRYSRRRFVPLLFALAAFVAPTIAPAGTGAEYSRNELMGNSGLAVFRAADFGWQLGLAIYLDGVPLTTLSRGEGYHAIVRPGKHKLTVTNTPSPYGKTNFSHKTITLRPGQNYSFTAIWDVQYISIEDGGYVYHGFYR